MHRSTFLLLALALLVPRAARAQEAAADSADQVRRAVAAAAVDQGPSFVDRAEVPRLVDAAYPAALKAAGVSGQATVRLVVDERGHPLAARVHESSGYAEMDGAALRVVAGLRFVPAVRGGAPHPVWVELPVAFVAPAGAGPRDPADAPAAIRMEEADEPARVLDPQAALLAAERAYPAPLRAAGVGGTATLRFVVDERGSATAARVLVSSGNEELDRAALRVLEETRFEPARRGRERVAAWMTLAVPFSSQPHVYEMTQVDELPELMNRGEVAREIDREYREHLQPRGHAGTVTIELMLDREGIVTEAAVEKSPHPDLVAPALRIGKKMRFRPARLDGVTVPVRVVLPLILGSR